MTLEHISTVLERVNGWLIFSIKHGDRFRLEQPDMPTLMLIIGRLDPGPSLPIEVKPGGTLFFRVGDSRHLTPGIAVCRRDRRRLAFHSQQRGWVTRIEPIQERKNG
jgi:hypothetical protein